MSGRDDFPSKVKECAAKRVGYLCSNPDCRRNTVCASEEGSDKVSCVGVAAHICAAALGGKRYDAEMSRRQRSDVENCIWLCQTHARLIDTDEKTYTVETLKSWKRQAEEYAVACVNKRPIDDEDAQIVIQWYDMFRIRDWETVTADLLRPRCQIMRRRVYEDLCAGVIWLSKNVHRAAHASFGSSLKNFFRIGKTVLDVFLSRAEQKKNFLQTAPLPDCLQAEEFSSQARARHYRLLWELVFEWTKAANEICDFGRRICSDGRFKQKINLIFSVDLVAFRSAVVEYAPDEDRNFKFDSFLRDVRKRLTKENFR